MSNSQKYLLPSDDVNDISGRITEVHFKSGDKVMKGDIIYTFETAKALVEVESKSEGFIKYNILVGNDYDVGFLICEIFNNKEEFDKSDFENPVTDQRYKLTKKAEKFAIENKLKLDSLPITGLIKEKDLYDYVKNISKEEKSKIKFNDNDIAILGKGGHASLCLSILEKQKKFKIKGNIVQNSHLHKIKGDIIGYDKMLPDFYKNGLRNVIIGIGDIQSRNKNREKLFKKIKSFNLNMPNLIDEKAIIDDSVSLGEGNQIMAGAIIGPNCKIGNNNIINTGAILSHDCKIYDNVHIAPGAIIAADVEIENNCLIGMGSTIYRGLTIGSNALIANGKNIFNDVKKREVIS